MEVSRIEAAPTKIIDWRRLTAKEIIKYNNDGVEVPPQYLKWAIDFRQDLDKNDKDETTYEMAQNQKIQESRKKERTQAQDNEGNRQETVNGEVQGNPAADIQTENKKTAPLHGRRAAFTLPAAGSCRAGAVWGRAARQQWRRLHPVQSAAVAPQWLQAAAPCTCAWR